jgi:high affinity Mn2+ porin
MFRQTLRQLASLRSAWAVGAPLLFGYTAAADTAIAPEFTAVREVSRDEQGSRFGWPTDDESRFVARAQATYAWIHKLGFDAPYTGPQSLATRAESSYTLSFTGFIGARAWEGGEFYVDPEAFQAHPLSNLFGLAGIQNGELQKASGVDIRAYLARAFIRQSFEFGGESRDVPAGFNQLLTHYDSRRLVFSVGKFPLTDFFERSSYANDPRTQFMNWALITYGAYDYAADARGYDIGAIAELYWDNWAFRAGRGMEPIIANGRSLYYNLFRRHGDQVEIEHEHLLRGQPGAVRVLVYRNLANAGNYREAVAVAAASGSIPDITTTRSLEAKTGYGVSVGPASTTRDRSGGPSARAHASQLAVTAQVMEIKPMSLPNVRQSRARASVDEFKIIAKYL